MPPRELFMVKLALVVRQARVKGAKLVYGEKGRDQEPKGKRSCCSSRWILTT